MSKNNRATPLFGEAPDSTISLFLNPSNSKLDFSNHHAQARDLTGLSASI
jgi:hypothetical protein